MSEQEAIAYIEEWDVTEAAKVLKWYEDDKLLRPCDCDTMIAIETEDIKAENAKLREEIEAAKHDLQTFSMCSVQLDAENAKLRELVRDMWFWGYCGHMDSESQEWQMKHIDGVLDRMRELGVEVD